MQHKAWIVLFCLGAGSAFAALSALTGGPGRTTGPVNSFSTASSFKSADISRPFGTRGKAALSLLEEPEYNLAEPIKYSVGTEPVALAVGDVSGDGLDDVALLTRVWAGPSSLVLYVQQPGVGLVRAKTYQFGIPDVYASGIRFGDLNNDAVMDIVVSHSKGLTLFTAQADGDFAIKVYESGGFGDDLGLLDVDRDGYIDVVVKSITYTPTTLVVLYGDGVGGIRSSTGLPGASGVSDIEVGDVTGDDLPDVVTAGGSGFEVHALTAAGGFSPVRFYPLVGGWSPNGVALGDFNSDGLNDVAVTRGKNSPTQVWMHYQDIHGSLQPGADLPTYDIPDDAFAADLDRDGRTDLIVSHTAWVKRGYYLQGEEGLQPEVLFQAINNWNSSNGMAAGDINNDGCSDLIYVESDGMSVRYGSNCHVASPPRVSDDVDGDDKTDMLWRNDLKTDFAYWLMDGAERRAGYGYAVGSAWNLVSKGDFNGDGALDLVWSDGHNMQLWQRHGDSYQGLVMPSYPQGYRLVATGDVDGDGKSDLLWRDQDNSILALWVMDGAWPSAGRAYSLPVAWRVAAAGDLDGDRRLDLVLASGTRMELWRGARNLVWSTAAMGGYPVGWELTDATDIDGDGHADLLWRHAQQGYFVYWRMRGPRRLSGVEYRVDASWRVLDGGDYNGDGKADIVWSNGTHMQLWASLEGGGFAGLAMSGYPGGWTLQ